MAMASTKRRYSKEEFARRGDALVESKVRPFLTAADEDKFIAIDIETGEYELDKNEIKAADRLHRRVPGAQIWLVHVTLGYLHRFGGLPDLLRGITDDNLPHEWDTGPAIGKEV